MSYSMACSDWERRIVAQESLIALPPLYPDVGPLRGMCAVASSWSTNSSAPAASDQEVRRYF
jgi:hypothetical protein